MCIRDSLWKPLLCLLLAALTLSGCSGQPSTTEQFPEVTQALGPATPTPEPIVLETETDPSTADAASGAGTADASAPQSIFDTNPYDVRCV